jgi:hypothetical protein
MRVIRFIALTALVSLSLAAGISAALRLTRPVLRPVFAPDPIRMTPVNSTIAYRTKIGGQSTSLLAANRQPNILELPTASADFVGYWGGYIHSSIQRFSPDLTGTSPDRVSVVFGRKGDTVFMASELYSSPNQKVVRGPRTRIIGSRLAIVEYESTDNDLYYICSHRFRLNDGSSISYQSTIGMYDRNSHRLMGIVTQAAKLRRLLRAREQLLFARPSQLQIPRNEISASANFAPH